jgi:hypothetical protein
MTTTTMPVAGRIREEHEEYLFPAIRPYYREPIVIAEASGMEVVDAEGRRYLDFFAGILTTSIGHCHPEVVGRVHEQMTAPGPHLHALRDGEPGERRKEARRPVPGTAEEELLHQQRQRGGGDGGDAGVHPHRAQRDRGAAARLLGRSILTTNITAHAPWRPVASSVAGIKHALSPYPYRSPFGALPEEEAAELFARDLEEVIVTTTNGKPAAFIAETIQGVGGYIVPPRGYFQRAAEIIRRLRRTADHRRGAGGVRAHGREVVRHRALGRRAGHHGDGQGDRERLPGRGDDHHRRDRRQLDHEDALHLRWQPDLMAATEATLDVMVREDVPARAASAARSCAAGWTRSPRASTGSARCGGWG